MKRFHYVLSVILLFSAQSAFAFEANFSNTDVGFDLYDLVFNKGLNGPIGWVVVIALVIMGFVQMAKGAMMPCLMSLGSGVMIKASPSVLKTLGAELPMNDVNVAQVSAFSLLSMLELASTVAACMAVAGMVMVVYANRAVLIQRLQTVMFRVAGALAW